LLPCLPKLVQRFTPAQVLKQATADNAELLALSRPRNPYFSKLGLNDRKIYKNTAITRPPDRCQDPRCK
jgi:hypothetical protein